MPDVGICTLSYIDWVLTSLTQVPTDISITVQEKTVEEVQFIETEEV